MTAPLAAAKRAQAVALRAQALACDAEADALDAPALAEADPFLPLDAAAALTGKSPRAVRDAVRRAELPGYGRPVVVRRSDVLAWLQGLRVRPRPTTDDADAAYDALTRAS